MYSGVLGTELTAQIYMGVVYYQRLRHMVSDKFQVGQRILGYSAGCAKVTRSSSSGNLWAGGGAPCKAKQRGGQWRCCGLFPTVGLSLFLKRFRRFIEGNLTRLRCDDCNQSAEWLAG